MSENSRRSLLTCDHLPHLILSSRIRNPRPDSLRFDRDTHTLNHSAERWLTLESEFPSRRSNYTSRTLLLSRCRSCAKRHEESYLSRRRRRHDNTLVRLLKLWGRRLDCKCVWDGVFPFIGCGISFVLQSQEDDCYGSKSVPQVSLILPEEGLQHICGSYPRHRIPTALD